MAGRRRRRSGTPRAARRRGRYRKDPTRTGVGRARRQPVVECRRRAPSLRGVGALRRHRGRPAVLAVAARCCGRWALPTCRRRRSRRPRTGSAPSTLPLPRSSTRAGRRPLLRRDRRRPLGRRVFSAGTAPPRRPRRRRTAAGAWPHCATPNRTARSPRRWPDLDRAPNVERLHLTGLGRGRCRPPARRARRDRCHSGRRCATPRVETLLRPRGGARRRRRGRGQPENAAADRARGGRRPRRPPHGGRAPVRPRPPRSSGAGSRWRWWRKCSTCRCRSAWAWRTWRSGRAFSPRWAGGELRFAHALTRDAVRASIPTSDRCAAPGRRRRAGGALGRRARRPSCRARLAPAGARAVRRGRRGRGGGRCGRRKTAMRRLAFEEAVRLYRAALRLGSVARRRIGRAGHSSALGRACALAGDVGTRLAAAVAAAERGPGRGPIGAARRGGAGAWSRCRTRESPPCSPACATRRWRRREPTRTDAADAGAPAGARRSHLPSTPATSADPRTRAPRPSILRARPETTAPWWRPCAPGTTPARGRRVARSASNCAARCSRSPSARATHRTRCGATSGGSTPGRGRADHRGRG